MAAVDYGADALGFNFFKKSPRYIEPHKAAEIITQLPPFIVPVAIFVNEREERIRDILMSACIHGVQFHGDETPEFCQRCGNHVIKAFQVKDKESIKHMAHYRVSAYLLDSYREGVRGGTGHHRDHEHQDARSGHHHRRRWARDDQRRRHRQGR
jgi:phosphoribosylanthranilate isomerase